MTPICESGDQTEARPLEYCSSAFSGQAKALSCRATRVQRKQGGRQLRRALLRFADIRTNVVGMSRDGPGNSNTNGLATWLRCKDFSATETNYDARWVNGKQKLESAMAARPHLRTKAAKLLRGGLTDPWDILWRLGLAKRQFTFRNGVSPAKRDHS